jgi:RNA polymerase primary sigma factor
MTESAVGLFSASPATGGRRQRAAELAERFQNGDETARSLLVTENMPLVRKILASYYCRPSEREDALQEGALGLMRAVDLFRPEKGYAFSTYATIWIRKYIFDYLTYRTRTIRLPETVCTMRRQIQAIQDLSGVVASPEEIALILDCSVARVREVLTAAEVVSSVDDILGRYGDRWNLLAE